MRSLLSWELGNWDFEGRGKKEEGRRKREEGRRKKFGNEQCTGLNGCNR
ncbi:hypothetical protein NDI47_17345 [Microcoleus vaginatus GB1-A2]|nr:hypothetical protein [Microcoleus sp. FACHB-61]